MRPRPGVSLVTGDPVSIGDGYGRISSTVIPVNLADYGLVTGGAVDNAGRIQQAITDTDLASVGSDNTGAVVELLVPAGYFRCAAGLVVPSRLNSAIRIRGVHRRNSTIAFDVGVGNALSVGDGSQRMQYFEMSDLTIRSAGAGTDTGIYMNQPYLCSLRNLVISEFSGVGGTGLFVEGAAAAGISAQRNFFERIVVANCRRPLRLRNVDECTFLHTTWGLPLGMGVAVIAVEIEQGRNNRFYSLLCAGDTGASRPNYRAVQLDTPAAGNNLGHIIDGWVAEGFDIGLFIQSSTVTDIDVRKYNSSINRAAFNNGSDDGSAVNERQNNITIEMVGTDTVGGVRSYRAGGGNPSEPVTIGSGDTSPSVRASEVFAFANAGATNVDNFDDGRPGQRIFLRLDANTTIRHNAPGNIRTSGGANIVGTANDIVQFVFVGGLWYQSAAVVAIP